MGVFEVIALALGGLMLGRLLGISIDRLPDWRGAAPDGKSKAEAHPFVIAELIPKIAILRAVGSNRSTRLSPWLAVRDPLVEVLTAVGCVAIPWVYGFTPAAAILIFYLALFIHVVFVDLERCLILNVVVLPAIPIAAALFPFTPLAETLSIGDAYIKSLSGAGVGFGMMLVVFIASRGGTGAGDVKLAALLGAMLGFPAVIPGLLIGFTAGGLVGIIMLASRLKGRRDSMPFGPALVSGAVAVLLGGTAVYTWYLDLFR